MKTIRVTGRGQLRLKLDTTRITMTLEGLHKDYGQVLKRSAEKTEVLRDVLACLGFARGDLKTVLFSVDTEYESYREEEAFRQRFAGYRYRHELKAEFPSDDQRLTRVLTALAGCEAKPEFRLSFTVSDPERAKNALLAGAVADAREKAAALSRAAGAELREVQSIDYSRMEIAFESRPVMDGVLNAKCMADSIDLDIEPDDIEVSDTVTIVWEIG